MGTPAEASSMPFDFTSENNPQPDPVPEGRHLVLQNLETAVQAWLTLVPEWRQGGPYNVDREEEPIAPNVTRHRCRFLGQDDEDWGPWWEFDGTWQDEGWIVEPVSVPVEDHPGSLYFLWKREDDSMNWYRVA